MIRTLLLINTLNANGLNTPLKRHKANEWIRKQGQEEVQDGGGVNRSHTKLLGTIWNCN